MESTNTNTNQSTSDKAKELVANGTDKAKDASKTVIAYAKEKPDMAALFVLGVLNLFS